MILGIIDPTFFDRLAAAGIRFRLVDDPMAIASPVELMRVGAAGLYASRPIDGATLARIAHHQATLRALVGGFGLAELQRSHRLAEKDAHVLAHLLVDPDLIDYLLTPENSIGGSR